MEMERMFFLPGVCGAPQDPGTTINPRASNWEFDARLLALKNEVFEQ